METTNDNININCAEGELYTAEIAVESMDEMIKLFGVFDENLKVISSETGARITAAGDCILIEGSNKTVELAATVVDKLLITIRRGDNIDRSRIRYAVDLAKEGNAELITELESDVVAFTAVQDAWPKEIRQRAKKKHGSVRSRPCRYGQDISCGGHGCACVQKQRG